MTSLGNHPMTLSDFERLLGVYGSERARWPAEARAGASQLVARDAAARRLLFEAEALDRVLERAPLPSLASEAALAERIVAAAQRSPRIVRMAGKVGAVASLRAESGGMARRAAARLESVRWPSFGASEFGRAASLLAACLVLGVLVGVSSLSQPVLPAFAEMTGLALDSNAYVVGSVDPFDEDLL
jgi:hypothetical protein